MTREKHLGLREAHERREVAEKGKEPQQAFVDAQL